MKTANIVIWLHGVQAKKFDPEPIYSCQAKVQELIKNYEVWNHTLYNWDAEVTVRERMLWDRVRKRGNWLTLQVKEPVVFTGVDMLITISTLKNGHPVWLSAAILNKLEAIIKERAEPLLKEGYAVKYHLVCHSWGTWIGMKHIIDHPETDFNFITFGCPLFYCSPGYEDWGSPTKIPNMKSWTNIGIQNDPISTVTDDNPNPEWKEFVKEFDLKRWQPLPIKSHTMYWSDGEVQKIIAKALMNFAG